MRRTMFLRAALAMAALAWALACGQRDAHVASPHPPTAPPASTSSSRTILAATSGDYAPLSIAHGTRFEGFAPALVTAFAATRDVEVTWARFRWTELASDMRAGRFDLAADGITVRPERSIAGRFTVPIARGGAVLLVRVPGRPAAGNRDAPLAVVRALDRAELRVGVNRGGHLERVTRDLFRAADVQAIADNSRVREALARGEVDAVMTNTFEAPRWSEGIAGLERVGPLTNDVTALWVRAEREDLANAIDAWLIDEEESGRLQALRTKELGEGAGPPAASVVSALGAAIAERLALMPFVAAAKHRAGQPVEDAAQEERVLAAARAHVASAARSSQRSAPPADAVDDFVRLQITAAKAAQTRASPATDFDLDRDLRPAIARITARQANLIVRVPRGLDAREVADSLRRDLGAVDDVTIDRFARALVALGTPRR